MNAFNFAEVNLTAKSWAALDDTGAFLPEKGSGITWGEKSSPTDISHSIDAFDTGILEFVYDDMAFLVGLNPLEPQRNTW